MTGSSATAAPGLADCARQGWLAAADSNNADAVRDSNFVPRVPHEGKRHDGAVEINTLLLVTNNSPAHANIVTSAQAVTEATPWAAHEF